MNLPKFVSRLIDRRKPQIAGGYGFILFGDEEADALGALDQFDEDFTRHGDDAAMLRFDVVGMCLPRFFVMGVALVIVRGRGLVDGAKRSENGDDMQ